MHQAVVLIHGIGEQKPMDTLRPFTAAVLDQKRRQSFYSKPDSMSGLFELRRLQVSGRINTHFYEYYWAYNIEGTSVWEVLLWLFQLGRRKKLDVPIGAIGLWYLVRVLGCAIIVGLVFGGFAWFNHLEQYTLWSIVISGALLVIQYLLVYYLGDAARYLSPRPRNIKLRQKIRADGLNLLKTLHESRKYDRIVVVGHSLGSVIGYDLITHLWQEYNDSLPDIGANPEVNEYVRTCMDKRKSAQPVIRNKLSAAGGSLPDCNDPQRENLLNAFRFSQREAWLEQRSLGNAWRITDFVTVGSPLAHAMILQASSAQDFEDRKHQRELVTCPPVRDNKGYAYSSRQVCEVGPIGQESTRKYAPLFLHHAAPFAVTRWTNLYFPPMFGLLGDFVGGKLAPTFGLGIKDVAVTTRRLKGIASKTLLAHTSYWLQIDRNLSTDLKPEEPIPALYALIQAISLDELRRYKKKRPRI